MITASNFPPLLIAGNYINLANEEPKYSNLQIFVFWQAGISVIYEPVSPIPLVSEDDTLVISISYPYHRV